jgi:fructose-1,6-bisphosphatase/inositol monophosphatase family enzyme
MTSAIDIAAIANILQEAAVTEILPKFRNLGTGDVRMKSEAIDLVTEADEAAERLIKARMAEVAPDALFIGEESVAADPALLDRLAGADLAVIVDPIDGTFNYAAGMPLFGVMASVVAKGETVAGVIYDPMGNDWVIAERGAGAWLCKADGSQERLGVAPSVSAARQPDFIRRKTGASSWATWQRSVSPPAIAAPRTNTAPSRRGISIS